SNPKAFEQLKAHAEQHRGVFVAGYGSAAFQEVYMETLDILGSARVEIANNGRQKVADLSTTGFMPLSALIERLPTIGADSLLYIKVEPGMTSLAATVHFQCFDATGHILWEEKATDVLVNGGNTLFHPRGWKSKLTTHIGKPDLLFSQAQQEVSPKSCN